MSQEISHPDLDLAESQLAVPIDLRPDRVMRAIRRGMSKLLSGGKWLLSGAGQARSHRQVVVTGTLVGLVGGVIVAHSDPSDARVVANLVAGGLAAIARLAGYLADHPALAGLAVVLLVPAAYAGYDRLVRRQATREVQKQQAAFLSWAAWPSSRYQVLLWLLGEQEIRLFTAEDFAVGLIAVHPSGGESQNSIAVARATHQALAALLSLKVLESPSLRSNAKGLDLYYTFLRPVALEPEGVATLPEVSQSDPIPEPEQTY